MGPEERAVGNDLHVCDFIEGVMAGVDFDFTSAFNDFELSATLGCRVFVNDRVADFGAAELLGAPEGTDSTKSHRRCNNDEDVAIKILTGR